MLQRALLATAVLCACTTVSHADDAPDYYVWHRVQRGGGRVIEVHRVVDAEHGVVCYMTTIAAPDEAPISCVAVSK